MDQTTDPNTPGGLDAAHRREAQRRERGGTGWPCEGGPADGTTVPDSEAPRDLPGFGYPDGYVPTVRRWSRAEVEPAPIVVGWYRFEEWNPLGCSRYVWHGGPAHPGSRNT